MKRNMKIFCSYTAMAVILGLAGPVWAQAISIPLPAPTNSALIPLPSNPPIVVPPPANSPISSPSNPISMTAGGMTATGPSMSAAIKPTDVGVPTNPTYPAQSPLVPNPTQAGVALCVQGCQTTLTNESNACINDFPSTGNGAYKQERNDCLDQRYEEAVACQQGCNENVNTPVAPIASSPCYPYPTVASCYTSTAR